MACDILRRRLATIDRNSPQSFSGMTALRLLIIGLCLFGVPVAAAFDAVYPEWLDRVLGRNALPTATQRNEIWPDDVPRRLPPVQASSASHPPASSSLASPASLASFSPESVPHRAPAKNGEIGPPSSPAVVHERQRLEYEIASIGGRSLRIQSLPQEGMCLASCVVPLPQNPAYAREFRGTGADSTSAIRELVRAAGAWRQAQIDETQRPN